MLKRVCAIVVIVLCYNPVLLLDLCMENFCFTQQNAWVQVLFSTNLPERSYVITME